MVSATPLSFGGFGLNSAGQEVAGDASGSLGTSTTTLVNQLATAYGLQATNDQTQITANGKVTSALNQFQSLLTALETPLQALSNPPGVGNQANNVFDFTTASVGNGGSSYLSVTAQPGAALQTYNISNISSLATAASQTTGVFTVASADASAVSANPISGTQYQFAPGTITFADGQTITLNEGDSLNTVANDFNAISGATGIAATVIQISSGQYELSFNATQTGVANSFNLANGTTVSSDPSGVLSNIGLTEQQSTGVFTLASLTSTAVASSSPLSGIGGIQFTPGTYAINGQDVTISEGDSLTAVEQDFNSVSSGTGITAHIVQDGAGAYQLAFTQNPGAGTFNIAGVITGAGIGQTLPTTTQQSTGVFTIANPNAVVASNGNITGTTGIQFTPGSYTINGKTVTISNNDTLADVENDFNSVSGLGVTASIAQAGTSGYQLVLTQDSGAGDFDLSGTLTGVQLAATVPATDAIVGTDANFDLNGIPITRSTNSVDDVITGLTFNLLSTTPNATTIYPVTVSPDKTTIQNTINLFVQAYNNLQQFAAGQTQLNSDGTFSSSSVLALNQTFRQTMADITQQINAQVAGLSGSVTSLAAAGITFTTIPGDSSSTPPTQPYTGLSVNDPQVTTFLSSNFTGAESLFGFNLASNNPDLALFSATNAVTATAFTVNADPGTNTFTATIGTDPPITLTATALPNNSGYTLTGPAGSELDGLEMIYASNNSATIDVTFTNGIASTLYNTANAATTANTGTLAVALTGLQTQNTTLNNDITSVNARVAQYKAQLNEEYAKLEALLTSNNNLLDSLAANQNAALVQSQLG